MRISVLFALVCTFAFLIAAAPVLAAQVENGREMSPGVQPDPGYPAQPSQSQTDDVTDVGTNLADGTSWAATIVAFLAGLGLGWVIFRRPATRRRDDMSDRRAA